MTEKKNWPSFVAERIYVPKDGGESKIFRVGVAFPHKNGEGHRLILNTIDGGVIELIAVAAKEGSNLPDFRAYRVIEPGASAPEDVKPRWIEVGAAWERQNVKGHYSFSLYTLRGPVKIQLKPFERMTDEVEPKPLEYPDELIINPEDIPF